MTNTRTKTVKEPLHCDSDNTELTNISYYMSQVSLMWSFISNEKCRTSAGFLLFLSDLSLVSAYKITKPVH